MSFTKHEEKVSDFYSRVADNSHDWNEGFLTFGIWKTKAGLPVSRPLCYKKVYDELLEGSMIQPHHKVLEVACGQGVGMMRIHSKYGCTIQGLDISVANVELATRRLQDTGITVTRGSATRLPYDNNSFDFVACIEGGPHFNTREKFVQEAFRVLKPGGKLFMADVVALKAIQECSYTQQFIMKVAASLWVVPRENMTYGIDGYKQIFHDHGFKTPKIEFLGERVIPGYCDFNLTLSVMRKQSRVRGPFVGYVGGPLIDVSLKKAFTHGILEYVFVMAEKPLNL